MGPLYANAPGPRESLAEAARLGKQEPSGAINDRAWKRGHLHRLQCSLGRANDPFVPAENFCVADIVNPTAVVLAGALVSMELVSTGSDMVQGLVVGANGSVVLDDDYGGGSSLLVASLWFFGHPLGPHRRGQYRHS